jgi:hypothetical protein
MKKDFALVSLWLGVCLIWFMWPILTHFRTFLPSRADGILISYLISWLTISLQTHQNYFNLPIFHPYPNTLTYSDPFLANGLLQLLISPLNLNLVSIHNIHLLMGTLTLFASAWWLSYELNKNKWLATLASTILVFGWWHFLYWVHLHTYLITGLVICWLGMYKWLKNPQAHRWLHVAGLGFLYQLTNAPFTAYLTLFAVAPLFFNSKHILLMRHHKKWLIGWILILTLIGGWLYFSYFQTARTFNYTRSIRDTAASSFSSEVLFRLDIWWVLGLLFWLKKQPQTQQKDIHPSSKLLTKISWFITLVGMVLMLGPVLRVDNQTVKFGPFFIPLPYGVLYYLLPGFKAFRASSRWSVLMGFGFFLLVSILGKNSRISHLKWFWILILTTTILWWAERAEFRYFFIPTQVPSVYSSIRQLPEKSMIEMPVLSWHMTPYSLWENDRFMYLTTHQKRLFNGTSGFTPPQRDQDIRWLWQHFPDQESLAYLTENQIELVLVNYTYYQIMWQQNFKFENRTINPAELYQQTLLSPSLTLVTCQNAICIYKLNYNKK